MATFIVNPQTGQATNIEYAAPGLKGVTVTAATPQAATQMVVGGAPATTAVAPTTTTTTTPTTTSQAAQLQAIEQQVQQAAQQAAQIQQSVQTLTQAKTAGMTITPQTSVEEAQKYLTTLGTVTPEVTLPTTDYTSYFNSLAQELAASRTALEKAYTDQIAALQAQQAASQAKIDAYVSKSEAALGEVKTITQPWQADLEKSERERLKVEENYFANQQSVVQLEQLLNQALADIQAAESVTGLAAIRTPRIAQIKTDYQGRVGVIEAVIACRNNQIAVANNLIDRSITAITNDKNGQLTYYNAVLNFYDNLRDKENNKLITLTQEERKYIDAQISLLQGDLEQVQTTANYIKSLLLNPDYAQLMESAGISLNDSVEQINAKMASAVYQKEIRDVINQMNIQGYTQLLPQQVATKPVNEVVILMDSKGQKYYFWKEAKEDLLSVSEAEALGVPYGTTRQQATTMGKIPGGEGTRFTQTQLNKGAASAEIPMRDFETLDPDTQNLYISGNVDDLKKEIDTALKNYENPSEIEREISESNLPFAVKDTLVRYLWSKTKRP